LLVDVAMGTEDEDDHIELIKDKDLFIAWDSDGMGVPINGTSYVVGYMGLLLLEHSHIESNGIDEDNDGMIDESKFNGPGELIEGKAAIDAYLEANYNMDAFN